MAHSETLDRTDSDVAARYALAAVIPAAALLLTLIARPLLAYTPSVFMLAGVVACAWYGGFGPAVLASLHSALTLEYFVMPPAFSWAGLDSLERIGAFVATGLVIAGIGGLHRRRERALTTLAAIVTSSNHAVIGEALDGTIVSWNPAAERLSGYAFDEVRGRNIALLLPTALTGEREILRSRLARGESVDHYQTTLIAKDGRRLAIDLTLSPIRDSRHAICGTSVVIDGLGTRNDRPQWHQRNANPAVTAGQPALQ